MNKFLPLAGGKSLFAARCLPGAGPSSARANGGPGYTMEPFSLLGFRNSRTRNGPTAPPLIMAGMAAVDDANRAVAEEFTSLWTPRQRSRASTSSTAAS